MNNPAQDRPAPQSTSYRPKVAPPPFEGPAPRTTSRPKPAAWEEMLGARPPLPRDKGIPETEPHPAGVGGASPQKQQKPAKPSPEERKKQSRLQAFQRELEEIYRLQKKRQEEMRARWQQHEVLKKQREEEAKKAHKPLFEPVTKAKRGLLGGAGRMFGLGKKQRQVEIAKTPTN